MNVLLGVISKENFKFLLRIFVTLLTGLFAIFSLTMKNTYAVADISASITGENLQDTNMIKISPVVFLEKYLASDIPMTELHRQFIEGMVEILKSYPDDEQVSLLSKFIRRLKAYTKIFNVLKLDKTKLLTVLEYTLDVSRGNNIKYVGNGDSVVGSHDTGIIQYDVYPAKEENKKVVVFKLESPKQIRRATWHRPDGSTYTCEMDQCKQIPKVRESDKSYEVVVYITYSRTESSREVLQVNVE